MKKIAIIGGGFSALNLAWQLSNSCLGENLDISIFEKENRLGGMAAGFKNKDWDWTLENHYHHLFAKDRAFKSFLKSLGLQDQLFYKKTVCRTRLKGENHQLDSVFSLLSFKQLSFVERLRTGLVLAFLKILPNGQFLEKYRASDFLQKTMGEKSWQIIWQPLFKAKFASWAEEINMAWFWARIQPRTPKLGYVEGGFQSLIDQIQQKLLKKGVKIHLNQELKKISCDSNQPLKNSSINLNIASSLSKKVKIKKEKFDLLISTLPSSQFKKIIDLAELKSNNLKGLAAMTLILSLKESFLEDDTYWLNINEKNWPFVAVVEHNNFIDQKHYNNQSLLYLGKYLSSKDKFFKLTAKQVLQAYLPFLRQINPQIEQLIIDYRLTKDTFAQPLVPINHSRHLPSMRTSCPNIYWVSMQHIYPFDRGINQAINSSNQLFKMIKKDLQSELVS
jgi:protoporphyrinogen oxidase